MTDKGWYAIKPKQTNNVETIAILVCKQISSYSFKNKITNKLFTYIHLNYEIYTYIYLNVCKQMIVKLFMLHSNNWNHLTIYIYIYMFVTINKRLLKEIRIGFIALCLRYPWRRI